ncbi:MAG: hypothetical protein KDI19_15780 [Pseudomonadales bacterium]|nr:hypothetical protein [Pseudomonadales bacterium]
MALPTTTIDWLLEGDPAIRWQVMRLVGRPEQECEAERALVATRGMGATLLSLQGADGSWNGVAWNRGWNSTMHVLLLLRDMGLDPESPAARRAIDRVAGSVVWHGDPSYEGNAFFDGEVEPCINGQTGAAGAYFRQDVRMLIERLLAEQLPDGGWNCDADRGSVRSSFNTTICVLEALLEYERNIRRDVAVQDARRRGEHYLLARHLYLRLSTGEAIPFDRKTGNDDSGHPAWTRIAFPTWWHYDVLRGLEYFRLAGGQPDERLAEAVALVASKADAESRWPLELSYPGTMPVSLGDVPGAPSRWNTLRAARVIEWYADGGVIKA